MITVCTLHVAPVIPSSAAIASMPIYNVTSPYNIVSIVYPSINSTS